MLFDLNGNTYQIKFFRDLNRTTHAELWIKDNDIFQYLISDWAYLSPKDRFVKSEGRKVALTKLLRATSIGKVIPKHLTKEDRTRIWEIYFKEHKK